MAKVPMKNKSVITSTSNQRKEFRTFIELKKKSFLLYFTFLYFKNF
jgi:hypothetical protein